MIVCVCRLAAHQRGSMFVPDAGARSRGIHVAEQTLCPPEGDATTSVTHLETKITVSLRNLFA